MTGILLVGHGRLASELLAVAEKVLGRVEGAEAVDFTAGQGLKALERAVRGAAARRDEGAGVLVLVDIKGGSPANVCGRLAGELGLRVLGGMNLPMLVKACTYRHEAPDQLAERVRAAGAQGVEKIG